MLFTVELSLFVVNLVLRSQRDLPEIRMVPVQGHFVGAVVTSIASFLVVPPQGCLRKLIEQFFELRLHSNASITHGNLELALALFVDGFLLLLSQ